MCVFVSFNEKMRVIEPIVTINAKYDLVKIYSNNKGGNVASFINLRYVSV